MAKPDIRSIIENLIAFIFKLRCAHSGHFVISLALSAINFVATEWLLGGLVHHGFWVI